ncbi:hypothetical protein [Bacillus mesophilum]|uniref:Uncharacterized protein n=1 Tax=Bacillus mesophilum TaxID=1071718 RepID=A0A7V7V0B2_9BACI|nr:hypothetical protein [Bacillus mesophilum]KAB2335072.1 hypothetical protein F7732_00410 [Bacillus mesophilum]
MEKLDFSPFQGQMNEMVLQLALILFIPLIGGLVINFVLVKIRLPQGLSNFVAIAAMLYGMYMMFDILF